MIATSGRVQYKSNLPYRLVDPWSCPVPIKTCAVIEDMHGGSPWVRLEDGVLYLRDGYAWALHSKANPKKRRDIKRSLLWDGIMQLVQLGKLPEWAMVVAEEMFRAPPKSGKIRYQHGLKYQLTAPWWVETGMKGHAARIESHDKIPWVELRSDGRLTMRFGWCFDGPSGPTHDTADFMGGAAGHDGWYDLLRHQRVAPHTRRFADWLLYALCRQNGMPFWRAAYVWAGVRLGATGAAKPSGGYKIEIAP